MFLLVILGCCWGISNAQYAQNSQPVYQDRPRQTYAPAPVHYVNIGAQLQGDYKFGYDTGKGSDGQSFREETRLPDGSVQGAYGYVDATGKQRIVKYTAGKDGFVAHGDVGVEGAPKATSPGPAPRPVATQSVAPQGYQPQQVSQQPPQQYGPPAGQYQVSNDVNNGRYYA
ncbi:adult-specific rigid cuticular protein 12.6-like [Centruroides sculpturatus]|uniref:adult-specific rigid cuticular protein 12.6-like n=1 Tax=Centruroides sculpturatus TaxID=218467 RepID=UPI000C6D4892|nr:adult-specific rigid cuticular protein 12.6-like [Centruroides sculpturatus]